MYKVFGGDICFKSEAHQKSRFASTRVEPFPLGGYLMLRHTHHGVCLDFLLSNCMFEINMTSPSPNRYQKLELPLLAKSSTIPINKSKKRTPGWWGWSSVQILGGICSRFVQDAWRFGSNVKMGENEMSNDQKKT